MAPWVRIVLGILGWVCAERAQKSTNTPQRGGLNCDPKRALFLSQSSQRHRVFKTQMPLFSSNCHRALPTATNVDPMQSLLLICNTAMTNILFYTALVENFLCFYSQKIRQTIYLSLSSVGSSDPPWRERGREKKYNTLRSPGLAVNYSHERSYEE